MEFSTLNGYKVKDKKAIRYYDTVADMKNDTTLKNGMHVKTKGYYAINDSGDSEYHITNSASLTDYQEELNNGLYATLIIKNTVNIKQFGAKGNDTDDDTTAIQSAIDYAYDKNILQVYVPFGTYKTTKPIFLYSTVKLYGDNCNSSIIHKSTNTISDQSGYGVDSIIILTNRLLDSNEQSSEQEIENIRLKGNVSSYVSDKENKQYAIYSPKYSPKIKIKNFLIDYVDYGIHTPSMYTGMIQNCTWLGAWYGAIAVTNESQGVNIQNINTGRTHEFGIKLAGGSYSTLSNILVEWNENSVCYDLSYWNGKLINCGAELGEGFITGIKLTNSRVGLTGGYFSSGQYTNSNLKMIDLNNSTLEITNSRFGYSQAENNYSGVFAYVHNKSSLVIGEGCQIPKSFASGVTSEGESNTLTINNNKINLNGNITSISGSTTTYEGKSIEYLDTNALTSNFLSNTLYTGFVSKETKTLYNNSIEYANSFNKGDLGVFINPTVNGKGLWLCNRNNKSSNEPQTVGTITAISSGQITMTDITLENYATTGERIFKNCKITGVTSGATATVSWYRHSDNTLHFGSSTDLSSFQVGEKVRLTSTTFVRNGDYLYIPVISSGSTEERPTENLVPGQMFFDETLGKPIWRDENQHWVDATGTQV